MVLEISTVVTRGVGPGVAVGTGSGGEGSGLVMLHSRPGFVTQRVHFIIHQAVQYARSSIQHSADYALFSRNGICQQKRKYQFN